MERAAHILVSEKAQKGFAAFLIVALLFPVPLVTYAQEADSAPATDPAPASTSDTTTTDTPPPADTPAPDTTSDAPATDPAAAAPAAPMLAQAGAAGSVAMPNALETVKLPQANEVSGAMTYQYKIATPPGRNNVQPSLNLSYSTKNLTGASLFGSGWNIDIPYIQRINKTGSENLYTSNYFYSSMSGELASTSSSTIYYAKSDDGSFLKYQYASNQWTATDKQGTVYTFGTSTLSRQDNPNDSTQIDKWMLEKVTDTNGNFVKYEYSKDSGQIYPQDILYTGTSTGDGIFRVDFSRTSRNDISTTTDTGFSVVTKYVINLITVKTNGVPTHTYTLAYAPGSNGYKSLLQSVTEAGVDESGATTTLPAMQFGYSTSNRAFTLNASYSIPVLFQSGSGSRGVFIMDVNGDGYPDIVQSFVGHLGIGSNNAVYLSKHDGTGWTLSSTSVPITFKNEDDNIIGVRVADVNGDGYPDLIQSNDSTTGVYINNAGTGWTLNSNYSVPIAFTVSGQDRGVQLADVNGDGYPDIIQGFNDGTNNFNGVYLNKRNGTGWTLASTSVPIAFRIQNSDMGARLVDVNADGLVDIVQNYSGTYGTLSGVYINTGATSTGWVADPSWSNPIGFVVSNTTIGAQFADINGDGLMDIIKNDSDNASGNGTYINTGKGFTLDSLYVFPEPLKYLSSDRGAIMTDVDADGAADIVRSDYNSVTGTMQRVYISYSHGVDYLTSITFPTGGSTAISYKTPANFKDGSGNLLNPILPEATQITSSLSTSDGLGTTATTDLSYKDSFYFYGNPLNKRYAGYGSITKTDAGSNTVTTFYHQGNTSSTTIGEYNDNEYKIGKPYRVEVRDSGSNLVQKTINRWDSITRIGDANYVKLSSTTDSMYGSGSSHDDKATSYTYDDTKGNVLQQIQWGAVTGSDDGTFTDTGSDKLTTNMLYASSSAATSTVIGLQSQASTTDQGGTKIKESRFYYDGLALNNIDKGNLTTQEDWTATSTYATTLHAYNSSGLVTQDTDPRNKVTTYTYDPYTLYVATTTNPLSQIVGRYYDYTSGAVKLLIDSNWAQFQTTYDGLDRPTAEKQPDVANASTTVTKSTTAYDDSGFPKITRTDYLDGSANVITYAYKDGLNRPLQTRRQTEDSNVYIVNDNAYSNRGLLASESLPYFSTGTTRSSATSNNKLLKKYTYDALSRPLTVATAVGTTNYAYKGWTATTTDPLGNAKGVTADAYGNPAGVTETNSGAYYVTSYNWDGLKDLTKITDSSGNIRNFTYNGMGWPTFAEDLHASADTTFGSTTYAYDNAGNLISKVDPKSQTVNYSYDSINRPLTEDYTGQAGTEIAYTYDTCGSGKGLLCIASSTAVYSSYVYNPLGLTKTETKKISGTQYDTTYDYDRQGNITTLTYPDNGQVLYTYNAGGLPETISFKTSSTSVATTVVNDFDYGPTNDVIYQKNANGTETWNFLDANALYRLARRKTIGPANGGSFLPNSMMTMGLMGIGSGSSYTPNLTPQAAPKEFIAGNTATTLVGRDLAASTRKYVTKFYPVSDLAAAMQNGGVAQVADKGTTWGITGGNYGASISKTAPKFTFTAGTDSLDVSLVGATKNPSLVLASSSGATSFTYQNAVAKGIDLSLTPTNGSVRKELVFAAKPTALGTGTATHDYTFKLGGNRLDVQADGLLLSQATTIKTSSDTLVLSNGTPLTHIWPAYAEDSGTGLAKQRIPIALTYEKRSDGIYVTKSIPDTWLAQATYPVRADFVVSVNAASGDGEVDSQPYPASWATQHADTTGRNAYYIGNTITAQMSESTNSTGYLAFVRAFMPFDTSSLPDNAIVGTSSLNVYLVSKQDNFNDAYGYVTVYQGFQAATSSIVNADINDCGNAENNPTKGSNDIDITNATTSAYNAFNLNASGQGWISATGYTKLCVREGHDATNNNPGNEFGDLSNVFTMSSAETSPANQAPYLSIAYTIPDTAPATSTNLLVDGRSNPQSLLDHQPYFSAQFNDPDVGDLSQSYEIQVSTSSVFASTVWDSGKLAVGTSSVAGTQSIDLAYGGTSLPFNGAVYYWRIKFWDDEDMASPWSTSGDNFMMADDGRYIQDLNYTYDAVGNITALGDYGTVDTPKNLTFAYDNLYRLTDATSTATSSILVYGRHYQYDKLGNITWTNDKGTYTYAGNTGSNWANPHAVTAVATSSATTTLSYDKNGNRTNDGTYGYTWDYRNRLTQAGTGSATSTYLYDESNLRTKLVEGTVTTHEPNRFYSKLIGGYSTTTKHIFVGNTPIATVDATSTGTSTIRFVHTDNLVGANVITDFGGNVTEYTDFYPYGTPRLDTKSQNYIGEKRKYAGTEYDSQLGMNYAMARYQNPSRGGFISEDPVHLAISNPSLVKQLTGRDLQTYLTDPQNLNSYSYARDNPITKSDPTGLYNAMTGAVQKGDTLGMITQAINAINKTNYSVNQVAQLNGISDPNKIKVGQLIYPNTTNVPDISNSLRSTVKINTADSKIKNGLIGATNFALNVRPGGPQDYKAQPGGQYNSKTHSAFVFDGSLVRNDFPGNVNYGYVGASTNWGSDKFLLGAAAGVQAIGNALNGSFSGFSDNPGDPAQIKQGIQLYRSGI